MKKLATILLLAIAARTAYADTVIWSYPGGRPDLWSVVLTAESDNMSGFYYYRGQSLTFNLTKIEDPSSFSDEYWATVTGASGTVYVSQADMDPDNAHKDFTIQGDETLNLHVWGTNIFTWLFGTGEVANEYFTFYSDAAGPPRRQSRPHPRVGLWGR